MDMTRLFMLIISEFPAPANGTGVHELRATSSPRRDPLASPQFCAYFVPQAVDDLVANLARVGIRERAVHGLEGQRVREGFPARRDRLPSINVEEDRALEQVAAG